MEDASYLSPHQKEIHNNEKSHTLFKLSRVIKNFKRFSRKTERIIRLATFKMLNLADVRFKKYDKDFDLEEAIRKALGPLLEVGGPTDYEYYQTDIDNSGRKMHVSNIYPGQPLYDLSSDNKDPIGYKGKVDLQADATNLAIRDNSLGVLFASCLPIPIRQGLLEEASRVLRPGGLFIVPGFKDEEIDAAKKMGFELKEEIRYTEHRFNTHRNDVVFEKRVSD